MISQDNNIQLAQKPHPLQALTVEIENSAVNCMDFVIPNSSALIHSTQDNSKSDSEVIVGKLKTFSINSPATTSKTSKLTQSLQKRPRARIEAMDLLGPTMTLDEMRPWATHKKTARDSF